MSTPRKQPEQPRDLHEEARLFYERRIRSQATTSSGPEEWLRLFVAGIQKAIDTEIEVDDPYALGWSYELLLRLTTKVR